MDVSNYAKCKVLTSSGAVTGNPALLADVLVSGDGAANPTITVFNDADASTPANAVMPATEFDAAALGLSGFMGGFWRDCPNGIYVNIAGSGTCVVVVAYRDKADMPAYSVR